MKNGRRFRLRQIRIPNLACGEAFHRISLFDHLHMLARSLKNEDNTHLEQSNLKCKSSKRSSKHLNRFVNNYTFSNHYFLSSLKMSLRNPSNRCTNNKAIGPHSMQANRSKNSSQFPSMVPNRPISGRHNHKPWPTHWRNAYYSWEMVFDLRLWPLFSKKFSQPHQTQPRA